MDCESWLPAEITREDEFLTQELEKLRDYVLKRRGEDISEELYIYENRVLYALSIPAVYPEYRQIISEESDEADFFYSEANHPIGWETIRTYLDISENGELRCYEIDKRKVKSLFLRGWLEVGMWDRGSCEKQEILPPPEEMDGLSGRKDQFIYGESLKFSMDMMRNYWRKYLSLKPSKRSQRPRFADQKQSLTLNDQSWHVFVTSELREFYYGEDKRIDEAHSEQLFFPLPKAMKTINCRKDTEARHAAIANYDSWQTFLSAVNREKGEPMNAETTVLGQFQKLGNAARDDTTVISNEIKRIIRKIARGAGIAGLHKHDRDKICRASEASPKIRMMLRMAQQEASRLRIGRYLARKMQHHGKRGVAADAKEILVRLKKWISPPLPMIPATASGGPSEQKHFLMEYGDIRFSYYFKGKDTDSACVWVSWEADMNTPCEIWARFMNPETKKIRAEISLGTRLEGSRAFSSKELGFDLLTEMCTLSVVLTKTA
jgi:hypothetical protein